MVFGSLLTAPLIVDRTEALTSDHDSFSCVSSVREDDHSCDVSLFVFDVTPSTGTCAAAAP